VDVKPTPLAPLIKETVKLARDGVPESIELDSHVEDVMVCVDPTQLQQALLNMINNAVDALDGVDEPFIRIRLSREHGKEGDCACLVVEDNGAGMPLHVKRRACDPYFTTKPPGKGTGLGLAMTKGFVEQCGGSLDIDSEPGEGCRIMMRLPLHEQDQPEPRGQRPAGIKVRPGLRVLLADDEDMARTAMADALRGMGCKVVEARDGRHALECLAQSSGIHVAVLDVVMPHMGGIQVARRMREVCPGVPVVLLTGYDANGQAASAMRDGVFDALLSKPIKPEHLAEHLARLSEKDS